MLNLTSVMIGTEQPKVLAAFYEKVFGQPAGMMDENLACMAGKWSRGL